MGWLTVQALRTRVQRWHPVKLAVIWAGYLTFSYFVRDHYYNYGWWITGSLVRGNDWTVWYLTWPVISLVVVWSTWQWASAREKAR
jgi:hypothetical protein